MGWGLGMGGGSISQLPAHTVLKVDLESSLSTFLFDEEKTVLIPCFSNYRLLLFYRGKESLQL